MDIQMFSSEQFHTADIPSLHMGQLHIWFFSLSDFDHLKPYSVCMSSEEQLRAERFSHLSDKQRYVIAHTCLRKLLGSYLNCSPKDLCFQTGEHGKPMLSAPSSDTRTIHFNLSHSKEQIVLAFSFDFPVGIDIEKCKSSMANDKLRKRFFHPEEECFFSSLKEPDKTILFYRFWTVREAFLKALGMGLSMSPASFCVEPDIKEDTKKDVSSSETSILKCRYYKITKSHADYSAWSIQTIPAPDGYLCSVAYLKPLPERNSV